MATLNTYLAQVRRLLRDAAGNEYSDSDLTDYINQAREDICQKTACLRTLATGQTILAGQESYTFQTFLTGLPAGTTPIDILGISVYWGSLRQKLGYLAWNEFDARLRPFQNIQQTPYCFSKYNGTTVYVGPKPDQNYTSDWDVVLVPNPLLDNTTAELVPVPFQKPIQFYAANRAKMNEQSSQEADILFQQYVRELRWAMASSLRRTSFNPYQDGGPTWY